MKAKRLLSMLCVGAMTATMLAGCGGGSSDESSSSEASSGPYDEQAIENAGDITITMMVSGVATENDFETEVLPQLVKEKWPNVTLEVTKLPDDNYYTTSTLSQNGQTFVSVQFVCSFFGLNWSYINGIGYGDILRITDGGGYLSDNDFLYAAAPLMRTRYEAYMDALDQAVPPSTEPDVSSTPEPTPPPEPSIDDDNEATDHSGVTVYLSFEGLPSEAILDTLERYGAAASFYLSPDDIAASPDTVRRIAGSGHTIGIYCSASCDYDYLMGSELLFDAAQIQTVMVTSSGSSFSACESFASNSGLYFSAYDADATARGGAVSSSRVINAAASASQSVHIRLDCSEGTENILSSVLNYLTLNSYTLSPERES